MAVRARRVGDGENGLGREFSERLPTLLVLLLIFTSPFLYDLYQWLAPLLSR